MEPHIGQNIKRLADEKKLRAQEIAYRWGKSTQAVYNVYKNRYPNSEVIIAFSKILSVRISEIFGEEGNSNLPIKETNEDFKDTDVFNNIIDELKNQLKEKDDQIRMLINKMP